jgi:N-acetyl-gamma-glutamyl-phosphate reductase
MIRVGILGATGLVGRELVEQLALHPEVKLAFATSEQSAGERLSDVYPRLRGVGDFELIPSDDALREEADCLFSCVPDFLSTRLAPALLERGTQLIDLPGDFRLDSAEAFERWYGRAHDAPELLAEAVYGLPELNREAIRTARLVANPGCYPTSVLLGLAPFMRTGLVADEPIIVDAKSGISGAGRKLLHELLFVDAHDNIAAYKAGRIHKHVGEMEQELAKLAGRDVRVVFTPQRVPLNRGMLSTLYVPLAEDVGTETLVDAVWTLYAEEPFVRVKGAELPEASHVAGTNFCDVGVKRVEGARMAIVVSVIDNLGKGAVGTAIQNMNLMFDLPEVTGFTATPVVPLGG